MFNQLRCLIGVSLACCAIVSTTSQQSLAQSSQAAMEKALDVMDRSPTGFSGPGPTAPAQNMPNQNMGRPMNGYANNFGGGTMPPQMMQQQMMQQQMMQQQMFNHPAPMPQPGMSNPFTMQNMLRVMLGGSSAPGPGGGASGDDSGNLQTALDQKQQAIDACNSISGERDKGVKEGLASQAQDHANAARNAADALYSSSCNSKSQQVKDMASRARNAANTAQSFADRARSKADGGGW